SRVTVSKGVTPRMLSVEEQRHNIQKRNKDGGSSSDDSHRHIEPIVIDPHAWQSLPNGVIYANNIIEGLSKADPQHAREFRNRGQKYIEQIKRLDAGIREKLAEIPAEQRRVITAHDAFGYFADEYDVEFTALMGLSSEAEPSARGLALL